MDVGDTSVASSSTSSISSLNSQLLSRGWAKRPLNLDALSDRECNDVVGVLFELLGSSITNIDNLDALSSRHRTLQYEFERLQKASTAQIATQRRMETDQSALKSKMVDLEKKIKVEEGKNRELREEVGRGRKAIEAVRVAAGHDTKKIQLKLDQANSKLTKIATDSAFLNQPQGFTILNPISQSRSLPTVSGQAPLLEQSLKDLAEMRENLQEEIEAFRNVIIQTANNLREVIAISSGDNEPVRLHQSHIFSTSSTLSSTLSSTHQIALSSYHPQIASERLSSLISEIRSKMSEKVIKIHTSDASEAVSPEEIEAEARKKREDEKIQQDILDRLKDMEVELECSRAREMETRKGMEEVIRQQRQESMDKAAEKDQDANDLLDVMKEREKLEDERRRLMDALSSLSKERRLFDRERQSFLEEKRRVDVDDVLAQLPTTPSGPPPLSSLEPQMVEIQEETEIGSFGQRQFWEAHKPHSPSPLSPHKNRTPRNHIAKNKRTKTPLSRLVLEKAVRRKSLGLTVVVAGDQKVESRQALGEGSNRTNTSLGKSTGMDTSKGKEKAIEPMLKSVSENTGKDEKKSPAASGGQQRMGQVKSITMEKTSLTVSQRKTVDLNKSTGIGPKGKGKAVWR